MLRGQAKDLFFCEVHAGSICNQGSHQWGIPFKGIAEGFCKSNHSSSPCASRSFLRSNFARLT
jgi:hypothetical protein